LNKGRKTGCQRKHGEDLRNGADRRVIAFSIGLYGICNSAARDLRACQSEPAIWDKPGTLQKQQQSLLRSLDAVEGEARQSLPLAATGWRTEGWKPETINARSRYCPCWAVNHHLIKWRRMAVACVRKMRLPFPLEV